MMIALKSSIVSPKPTLVEPTEAIFSVLTFFLVFG
jgi:hypothetical protein